ncbi:MAG: DUF2017 family protein [Microthrixaceae bacterium]
MGILDSVFEPPFKKRRSGRYSVNLSEDERQMIQNLVLDLRELLTTDSPMLQRLFPPPYGENEERNQGYSALAGSELVERKFSSLDCVSTTISAEDLSEEEVEAWMRSINDIRLVLGTVLNVSEDNEFEASDEAMQGMHNTYEYLGMLLERIVRALSV